MVIRKTRIRSLGRYQGALNVGQPFTIGTRITPGNEGRLPEIGFSVEWVEAETLLPSANHGPSCKRNAEGEFIKHTDQPKETAYREFMWTWTEFHGPYEHEESRIVEQSYQRYPRTFIPPTGFEVTTVTTQQGRMVVYTDHFVKGGDERSQLIAINVLLELFGEAEVLHADMKAFAPPTVRRVNWDVLPAGEHPWPAIRERVQDVLDRQGDRKRPVFVHRWSTISDYGPQFVAVGRAGFSGYLIFGFPHQDLYVLESAYYGNATYVLNGDWETLSQLTKAELLDEGLHRDRIVHRERWEHRIRDLLA